MGNAISSSGILSGMLYTENIDYQRKKFIYISSKISIENQGDLCDPIKLRKDEEENIFKKEKEKEQELIDKYTKIIGEKKSKLLSGALRLIISGGWLDIFDFMRQESKKIDEEKNNALNDVKSAADSIVPPVAEITVEQAANYTVKLRDSLGELLKKKGEQENSIKILELENRELEEKIKKMIKRSGSNILQVV